jgi:Domain of unknown function (DUF4157)
VSEFALPSQERAESETTRAPVVPDSRSGVAPRRAKRAPSPSRPSSVPALPVPEAPPALRLGPVGDRYEREADHRSAADAPVSRRVSRADSVGGTPVDPAVARLVIGARGQGDALPGNVRRRYERAVGTDLTPVRLHTDRLADGLNSEFESLAFTVGHDIFFRDGAYDPVNGAGDEVLSHELHHVAHQKGAADGAGLLIQRMAPSLPLDNYPTTHDPDDDQRNVVNAEIEKAIDAIGKFLASPTSTDFIDTVFGREQRNKVLENYHAMQQVLTKWRDEKGMVKLSGWRTEFDRKADTNAATKIITLPDFTLTKPLQGLHETLIHESAHGVNPNITDRAYQNAAIAFATIPDEERPLNAPYYDYTIRAWQDNNLQVAKTQAREPEATTKATDGSGAQQQVSPPTEFERSLYAQFGRAQSLIMHARIHAENMLEILVEDYRAGTMSRTHMGLATGLPMPFLGTYSSSVFLPDVQVKSDVNAKIPGDVDAVNRFVKKLTEFSKKVDATKLQITAPQVNSQTRQAISGPSDCKIFISEANGSEMTIATPGKVDTAQQPIQGHPINGDLTDDPWIKSMIAAMIAAYKPPKESGVTLEALATVDKQYHAVRGGSPHP